MNSLNDHQMCQKLVEKSLNNDTAIRYLIASIDKGGCSASKLFFRCMPCDKPAGAYFDAKEGVSYCVVVCENNMVSPGTVPRNIAHELVHAYDYCTANLNTKNCAHVACTEIRASNLSRECAFGMELARGNVGFAAQHERCVRRRAILSVQSVPACKEKAAEHVDRAFITCMKDTSPFPIVP